MDETQSSGQTASFEQDNNVDGMREGKHNALAGAASAYLRSAMHQPVDWMEWGEAAFDRAAREDKPILLDIGAVWCHWCHVMDRESYEDAGTARIINENFIAMKVDRDERPDVDTRYQSAVSAISGQGGWPLTAFLTPDGKPYFGGTYFPPEDRHGRPSFQRVLLTMAEAFLNRRVEVDESAGSVMNAIEHGTGRDDGDVGAEKRGYAAWRIWRTAEVPAFECVGFADRCGFARGDHDREVECTGHRDRVRGGKTGGDADFGQDGEGRDLRSSGRGLSSVFCR